MKIMDISIRAKMYPFNLALKNIGVIFLMCLVDLIDWKCQDGCVRLSARRMKYLGNILPLIILNIM